MKLLKFIDVCKSLLEWHSLRNSVHIPVSMGQSKIILSTGNGFRVQSITTISTHIEFQKLPWLERGTLLRVSRSPGYNCILRDDNQFIMNSNNNLPFGILKETTGVLNMLGEYIPFIDDNVPHDKDTLEFQYLTKYSMNEVQSMILFHLLNEYRKSRPTKILVSEYLARIVINFNVLDNCTIEELQEIDEQIRKQINELQFQILFKIEKNTNINV